MFSPAFEKLVEAIPVSSDSRIDWEKIGETPLGEHLLRMEKTPQNPAYHAEGDVLTHTKMVCEALISLDGYKNASREDRILLFLAALMHDIGKPAVTKLKDGEWTSPRHTSAGANIARALLWRDFSLSGNGMAQNFRESLCALIRYHSFPPNALKEENPLPKFIKIASVGELATGFSLRKLCLLEKADAMGRIAEGGSDYPERIDYCEMLAEEYGVADAPFPFEDAYSKRAFFRGKTSRPADMLYNGGFGEVIVMSGLPGTGKDTWIAKNFPDTPIISLDEIRKRLGFAPSETPGEVVVYAHEEAKKLLRKEKTFIWNATSLFPLLREKQITLFEQYGASVRTVFLETSWEEGISRNKNRKAEVPIGVIEKMLAKLEPPLPFECERVNWEIT